MSNVIARHNKIAGLLSQYGLGGARWRRLSHLGYSGASLFSCVSHTGQSWILKRTSLDEDWIMRATSDALGREYRLAISGLLQSGPVRLAAVGGARDGEQFYTLMRDISPYMFAGQDIRRHHVEDIVGGIARLHATTETVDIGDSWCTLENRLLLLVQGVRAVDMHLVPHGLVQDINAGWDLFAERAPRRVADLLHAVREDFVVLERALGTLPSILMHGDLKLDNLGVDDDGVLWLIDWALATRGPACVELGWFTAANSRRLATTPQELLDIYSRASALSGETRQRHEALAGLCGLLLRGWSMALSTEADGDAREFMWWCDRVAEAERYLS